ncbi:MAG TPA: FAD-linked oxidase C-terminal domain-containing protein [Ktedonobacterales bacterium]
MSTQLRSSFLADLARALPSGALITDPTDLAECGRDFWAARGVPGAVVRPTTEAHVTQALRLAHAAGIPVVTRAAGTNIGIGFAPAPDQLMLDMRSMRAIHHIDRDAMIATVEPGIVNGDLRQALSPMGLVFSPDPASSAISTVGGNIAENAGGPHCLKYGVTYHHVLSLRAALADGSLTTAGAVAHGPDVLGLLIGSEGTLAVTTEATVRLRHLPELTRTFLAVFDHAEDATKAVSAIIRAGIVPAALEFFDQAAARLFESAVPSGYPTDAEALLLIDLDGDAAQVSHEMSVIEPLLRRTARETSRADSDEARAALWRGRIYGARSFHGTGRAYHIGDIVVSREEIPHLYHEVTRIAHDRALSMIVNGHAGDGNLHPTIFFDEHDIAESASAHAAMIEMAHAAVALGGTITGEHGIGEEKRELMRLRFSPAEIATQRAIKHAFDPDNQLNPGVVLPDPAADEPPLPMLRAWLRARLVGEAAASEGPSAPPPDAGMALIDLDPGNLTVRLGADARGGEVRFRLQEAGLHSDALASLPEDVTVREALSAPGARASVRATLLAIEARLRDGERVRFGSDAIKDVAGYDAKRLFIGTGDEVGTVTSATFRLRPR